MLSIVLYLLLGGLFLANGDEGTGIDPHGGMTRTAARCGDEGNGFDPHGEPCAAQSLNTDEGNGFDPHG